MSETRMNPKKLGCLLAGVFLFGRIHANTMSPGQVDLSFAPPLSGQPNNAVLAAVTQPDGKVIMAGIFDLAGSRRFRGIARLLSTGGLDGGFDPGSGVDTMVNTLALQSDGKILIAGPFKQMNGLARAGVCRL